VAYSLQFNEATILNYLRSGTGLSRSGRVMLFSALHLDLRHGGDALREDSSRRHPSVPDCFWYDFSLRDDDGDGRIHTFRFLVNDAPARFGVLALVYVEEVIWSP
jgi:hypothetical protein